VEKREIEVIWQNDEAVVINKPAGLVVNRAESVKEETVQDWVEKQDWWKKTDKDNEFKKRSGLAHRLDKETSGCLLIAKKPESLKSLMAQFKRRETEKYYLALVHGWIEPEEGRLKLPLARSVVDRKKQEVRYDGKMAETLWRRKEKYEGVKMNDWWGREPWGNRLSLVEIRLMTGRMHQIRVHLAHLGFPIFSDEKYLGGEQWQRDNQLLTRHFLHAEKIVFRLLNGEKKEIKADLSQELNMCLQMMERKS